MSACQCCQKEIPKKERQFVDDETFAFFDQLPEGVNEGIYCFECFALHVQPALDRYSEILEAAKNVNMFYLTQSKESRFVRRLEAPITVADCTDKDETILRLAFKAVLAGKNALLDVDLKSHKILDGRYQTSIWSGRAVPANIDEVQLQRRFPGTPN